MKKIIFLLLLIYSVVSQAQVMPADSNSAYIHYPYSKGIWYSFGAFDKRLNIPADTIYSKNGIAIKGGTVYYGNGTMWTAATGGGGSMVYPPSGIPVSTGVAWDASITNNSANWNTVLNRVLYTDTFNLIATKYKLKNDSIALAAMMWKVGGNAGTTPGTHSIGSLDTGLVIKSFGDTSIVFDKRKTTQYADTTYFKPQIDSIAYTKFGYNLGGSFYGGVTAYNNIYSDTTGGDDSLDPNANISVSIHRGASYYVIEGRRGLNRYDTTVYNVGSGASSGTYEFKMAINSQGSGAYTARKFPANLKLYDAYLGTYTYYYPQAGDTLRYTATLDGNAASRTDRFIAYWSPKNAIVDITGDLKVRKNIFINKDSTAKKYGTRWKLALDTVTGAIVLDTAITGGAGGGYTAAQIDSMARIAATSIINDSSKNYYFESSIGGVRLFYKKNDSTMHFISMLAGNGIKIDTSYDANADTVYSIRVDSSLFATISDLSGKQNNITLTTTGTSGAATLVGSTLNIPQYSGGGSQTPWASDINGAQFKLNNVSQLQVKKDSSTAGAGYNLWLQSETLDVAPNTGNSVIVTANQALDMLGNNTMEEIAIISTSGTEFGQTVTVTPSTTYYLTFDVKRGTATDMAWGIWDITNSNELLASTSYYSLTSGTVQRIQLTFTTAAGCTSIALQPIRGAVSTGTFFLGRVQLALNTGDTYATTTTTAVTGGGGSSTTYNAIVTDKIGRVAVGKDTATEQLDVHGNIKTDSSVITPNISLTSFDTTNYKIVVVNNSTGKQYKSNWPTIQRTIYNEESTGSTATTITLANSGITGTLRLCKNGLRLPVSEYTYSGGVTVTLTSARLAIDLFTIDYNY